ncbi:MAG: polyamine ABC transporter substrate-binding protein [Gammaproteobacteria bacterium]|nr:polyamine ABC transporter substrate-binding protein [Gammaproteobacteria bacterium]
MVNRISATATAGALLALSCGVAFAAEEKVLNVYNWSDYIAEDTIANFEAKTGIKVNYDVFDSNEVLEAKLLAGSSGYDVVVPSASFMERQIKAGVFAKLNKSKLNNYGNLDAAILQRVAAHDPGNEHSIPYMWGTTGFGYNIKEVEETLAGAPVDSWDMLFNPEVVSKLQGCGVTFLDAPTEVFANLMGYLGRDPNSDKPEDVKLFEEHMLKVRPYIKYFHSSQNINDLANGEICVAMGWSGDMLIARDRAAEAEQGVEIAYTIPKEGAVIWFDNLAIPSDAPHPGNAHMFLDYIMEPQVAAAISNYVFYANGNSASLPLVDDEVKTDPGIYPSDAVKAKLFPDLADSAKFTRLLTRAWTRIKTGQ